ncbi:MAG: formate dehydrogenase subunit alpha, partial [Thermodesulfobacteriota bacterium]|nr:formate dehydrogenase subunit alpha [Thermodesulfobacteriota bacterium]
MWRDVETLCPFCGVGCRIVLRVYDEKVEALYPAEEGVNEGKLCIKGWSAHEFIHHPERLSRPLIREDRSRGFREVSWNEALDFIKSRLETVIKSDGPDAVNFLGSAKCTNEDNYALQKFARAVVGTSHIDHCARLCHASTVTGLSMAFGSGAMTNSIEDLEDAGVILLIGSNASEQHPLIGRRIIKAVKEKGAALIVADPRQIDFVEFSRLHLQHRPGTDTALINGILHVIIEEGREDLKFIEEHTEGFGEVAKSLEEYSPEHVEKITGVPSHGIVEAARLYAGAENASIVYAMGITQHVSGTDNVLALANLAMATGNVGRRGTGINPLRGQNNVQGACDVGVLPDFFPGYQSSEDSDVRDYFSKSWNTDRLPEKSGLTLCEMTDAILGKRTKWMYIMGENPALSDPDSGHVRHALEKIDFLVVHDIFLTETAAFADVVLPGASYAEKDGTFTSTERRVQRIREAVEPVGEARPEWQAIGDLATRMGYKEMSWQSAREVFSEIADVTPIYRGMSYERLESEGLQWPCPAGNHPGTPLLHSAGFARGKGCFVPVQYNPPPELPDEDYPFILMTGRSLFQFHTGTMTRRSPTLQDQLDEAYAEVNPGDAERLGILDGMKIAVESRRGIICVTARITETVLPGTVFIPFHFAEAAANILTLRELDQKSGIPELKVCAVRM